MQSNYRDIKNLIAGFLILIAIVFCVFFSGCASSVNTSKKVKVSIADSIFFTSENQAAQVDYGGEFTTILKLRSGYKFVSCDYCDYSVSNDLNGGTKLTLKNITRPSRVTVKCEKTGENKTPSFSFDCAIDYHLNGGVFEGYAQVHTENYVLSEHLRPNTWNGVGLEKDGYTLYGWNTEKDGSGEHIGLGSRVTVPYGGKITLYAEWLKQIDESNFLYKEIAKGACAVTGYRGDGDVQPFVIPSRLGGKEVVEIASSFTMNMPCGKLSAKTLVLPNTIKKVRGNSFLNSAFSELCFSDNIEQIDESAFPYNFKTYRINAYLSPCFQDKNNSTLFSDNFDRLILNEQKKKLIFFSGCSFAYGVNSQTVDEEFKGEYVVLNMGMNGDINGAFQMEILLNYIHDGDVLIHSPEQMSPSQLMFSFFTNSTMFVMTEGNYDLLALADFSNNSGVLRAFFDYLEIKKETEECSYSDGSNNDFNMYGDYISDRPYDEQTENERDVTYSDDEYCYESSYLTQTSIAKLASYYNTITAKGGRVLLSYAPVNISAREQGEVRQKGLEFAAKFESMLGEYGFYSISNVEDYMFPGRYFFDSDYHLNDIGAALRTEQLIKDLRNEGL